jgi:hypothetical protein
MIAEVFVAQCNPEHTLPHQRLNTVLDQFPAATIVEADDKPFGQSNDAVRLPQQQGFTLRCDRPATRTSHNLATADGCESGLPYTLSASGRFLR